jgi:ribosomal protein S20
LPHSSRSWTGARTPSAIKRVRQTQRRRLVNQPRRTAAKTLVAKAIVTANDAAHNGTDAAEVQQAVERAVSALDRAAKIGAIHKNAADRRKSRLMLKVNATLGGEVATSTTKQARQTSKAAAAKEAKARIAASKATKAKGAQTAAGKARAALAKTTRAATADKAEATDTTAKATTTRAPAKSPTKSTASKSTASKAKPAAKSTAKSTAKKS